MARYIFHYLVTKLFSCCYYQDTSFITLYFNEVLPRTTGHSMFVEFKAAHDYLLLPSGNKDQGTLESYQSKPIFVNLFKHSIEVAQVCIVFICLMSL